MPIFATAPEVAEEQRPHKRGRKTAASDRRGCRVSKVNLWEFYLIFMRRAASGDASGRQAWPGPTRGCPATAERGRKLGETTDASYRKRWGLGPNRPKLVCQSLTLGAAVSIITPTFARPRHTHNNAVTWPCADRIPFHIAAAAIRFFYFIFCSSRDLRVRSFDTSSRSIATTAITR
nr:hypothetical protein CFP56_07738 [Quercus suber]